MEREEKRLEQFRRLRKEIRGCQDYLVVGIDISKDLHNAVIRTVSGKMHRRLTFHNTREGFENLLLAVDAVKVQHGPTELPQTIRRILDQPGSTGGFGITRSGQQEPLAARWTLEQA
jgi:hypothetical protein